MFKKTSVLMALLIVFSIVLAQCAPAPVPTEAPAAPAAPAAVEPTSAPAAVEPTAAPAAAEPAVALKVAAIFPGVITDADYNTLAYEGLMALKDEMKLEVAYSESVAVPDVDRVMREYVDAGFNVVWTHGGQFVNQTVELAKQFPEISFIAEGDAAVKEPPANLWFIDRNFHTGYYAIGALAAKATKTGKIGYIGGQTLPFSYAEVHAIQQAIKDSGATVEFKPVWAGDFNDPTKARQVADAMISEKVDVIMGSLNLGMLGVFEAAKASKDKVLVTAKYTDKTSFAPDNYITSLVYDFKNPLKEIVGKIQAGENGGYYALGFDNSVSFQFPLINVDTTVNTEIEKIVNDVKSGTVKVAKDNTPIE